MAGAVGTFTQLGIDSASPVTKRFDFVRGNIGVHSEEFPDGNGLRGTLERNIERVRAGIRRVQGQIVFQPNAVETSLLLPWILGTAGSGSPTATYALADTALTRYVAVDRNAGNLATFDTVAVDTCTITGSEGRQLEFALDLVGVDETISGSFPSLTIDTANGPFMFHDCVLTVGGTTITPKTFTLTISNGIDRNRFFNSQKLSTGILKLDRHITFATQIPWGDFTALYNTGAGGVAVVITATNGGAVLAFSMVKVAFPRISPEIAGRVEVMLPLVGEAYHSGSTNSLVTTLNVGP